MYKYKFRPILPLLTEARERHFRKHFTVSDGCWLWTGASRHGYGILKWGKCSLYAHRVHWVIQNRQELPRDRVIDHACANKLCVNPAHLRVVTQHVNLLAYHESVNPDCVCKRGHHYQRGKGCKECAKLKIAEWKQANPVRWRTISRKYEAKRSKTRWEWHKNPPA